MKTNKTYGIEDAVQELRRIGISANSESYGFSMSPRDGGGVFYAYCGFESDGTFSLCFEIAKGNNQWFVAPDVKIMVEFICFAYDRVKSEQEMTWKDALGSVVYKDIVRVDY